MTPRLRSLSIGAFAATTAVALALFLLTLLHHLLSVPAIEHFDSTLQTAVHGLTTPSLTRLMLALTWLGAIKIFAPAMAAAVLWLAYRGRIHEAALLSGGIAGAFVLNEALKLHFHRPRPQLPWSIGDEHTFSYPSGHSLFAVVLYGTLAYLALRMPRRERRSLPVLLLAMLMPLSIGLSRIYLGMHYPTDVLAGWLAGDLWLAAIIIVDKTWAARPVGGVRTQTPTNSHPPPRFR